MRPSPLAVGAAVLSLALGATACSAGAASSVTDSAARRPVAGTVTVKAGNKVVCVMTLKAGKGTCKVNTAKYAPGTLKFVATYNGAGFKSSGGSASLRLKRATSKTSLSISPATLTYGHEQAERLSVRVAPQFAGTPSGRVTVSAGGTVVCVITLASGAGSCTLTAKKLAPGRYRLSASYPGSASFAASASAARTLVVSG
jgi:Bacterial Ig-like domain (group 3)